MRWPIGAILLIAAGCTTSPPTATSPPVAASAPAGAPAAAPTTAASTTAASPDAAAPAAAAPAGAPAATAPLTADQVDRITHAKKLGLRVVTIDGEVRYCRTERKTGSHLATETTCLTQDQLDQLHEQTSQDLENFRRSNIPKPSH
jgi:hypothetical protein